MVVIFMVSGSIDVKITSERRANTRSEQRCANDFENELFHGVGSLCKKDRWDGLVEVFQSLAGFDVVRFARFDCLRLSFEFADFDQGEIIPFVQYSVTLRGVVDVVWFHGLAPDEVMDKDFQNIDARQLFEVAVSVVPSDGRAQLFGGRLINCPCGVRHAMEQTDQLAFFKVIRNMFHTVLL
jgi:predicted ATP-dependent Lon-type protease